MLSATPRQTHASPSSTGARLPGSRHTVPAAWGSKGGEEETRSPSGCSRLPVTSAALCPARVLSPCIGGQAVSGLTSVFDIWYKSL